MRLIRFSAIVASGIVLSGCGLLGGKEDPELLPLELEPVETSVKLRREWSTGVGKSAENLRVALRPVGDGSRIYAASFNGRVHAFNPDSGNKLWTTELDQELSAGPAVGDGRIAVISKDGFLVVLDADSGAERWRTYIAGESLATPLIRSNTVVILTVDNRLRAYGLNDGVERWTIEESTPALTIRGNAAPVAVGTVVVAGFDNGRVLAVNLLSGDVEWQALLSPPSGRSDLDRLADVDGMISVVGQDVYAAGYQGRMAALAAESGQVLWTRELSTYAGLSADWTNVYSVLEGGEIIAMSRRTGTEVWRNETLLRREPTIPISFKSTVVVGDLEGYLHFFANATGEAVARIRTGKNPHTNPPVVIGDFLYVQTDSGELLAYSIPEPTPRSAPDIASDDRD